MNANELADELEKITTYKEAEHDIFSDKEKLKESATMLRQQQAEIAELEIGLKNVWKVVEGKQTKIEALKEKVKQNAALEEKVDLCKEKLEPVAWMSASGSFNKKETWIFHIPLYTHPAKTLTDEEWNKAFDCYCETDEGVLRFDYELRDEWKKEQLIRWKEAFRKSQSE